MGIDLTGVTNENEFYTHHYLAAILEGDLKPLYEAWSQLERPPWEGLRALARPFQAIQRESDPAERQASATEMVRRPVQRSRLFPHSRGHRTRGRLLASPRRPDHPS